MSIHYIVSRPIFHTSLISLSNVSNLLNSNEEKARKFERPKDNT